MPASTTLALYFSTFRVFGDTHPGATSVPHGGIG